MAVHGAEMDFGLSDVPGAEDVTAASVMEWDLSVEGAAALRAGFAAASALTPTGESMNLSGGAGTVDDGDGDSPGFNTVTSSSSESESSSEEEEEAAEEAGPSSSDVDNDDSADEDFCEPGDATRDMASIAPSKRTAPKKPLRPRARARIGKQGASLTEVFGVIKKTKGSHLLVQQLPQQGRGKVPPKARIYGSGVFGDGFANKSVWEVLRSLASDKSLAAVHKMTVGEMLANLMTQK